eukprot:1020399-Prorocentrum_minimum.AAC.1
MLTQLEEERVLGMGAPSYKFARAAFVPTSPEDIEVVEDDEQALELGQKTLSSTVALLATLTTDVEVLVREKKGKGEGTQEARGPPSFPLVAQSGTHLETSMLEEQKASWEAHHSLLPRAMHPRFANNTKFASYLASSEVGGQVIAARERLERHLLK